MNHLDLCSGIGGFALAARWAGIETIMFCEIDEYCKKVLAKNFNGVPIVHDINNFPPIGETETHGKGIDILTAGFP